MVNSGSSKRSRFTFSVGPSTSASPAITFSPSWLVHRHSNSMCLLWSNFCLQVTFTVMVSPTFTGREKRSVWPM